LFHARYNKIQYQKQFYAMMVAKMDMPKDKQKQTVRKQLLKGNVQATRTLVTEQVTLMVYKMAQNIY